MLYRCVTTGTGAEWLSNLSDLEIADLLEKYKPLVQAKVRSMTYSSATNSYSYDDVFQEVMIRVWKELKKYDPEVSPVPIPVIVYKSTVWQAHSFIFSEGRRTTGKLGQSLSVHDVLPIDPSYPQLECIEVADEHDSAEFEIYRDVIVDAMRDLTYSQKVYLVDRVMFKASYKDIEDKLGYYSPGIMSPPLKNKMRRRLKKLESMVSSEEN